MSGRGTQGAQCFPSLARGADPRWSRLQKVFSSLSSHGHIGVIRSRGAGPSDSAADFDIRLSASLPLILDWRYAIRQGATYSSVF